MEAKQAGFRLPVELLDLLDQYTERVAAERPGVTYSRSDAVRELLYQGLAQAGITANGKKRK